MAGHDGTNSKVGRLVQEYDLEGFGEELESRWTAERGERESLRELADAFNRRVLRSVLEDTGRAPATEQTEHVYELLTSDDVSQGARTRIERDLERDGIAVDDLTDDFVSHQAIHTYLTEYRGAEVGTDDGDVRERSIDTVQRLRNRTAAVTDTQLSRLLNREEIEVGEHDVLVDVTVFCDDCGRSFSFADLVESGQCGCFEGG
jgi:hypothetical protein